MNWIEGVAIGGVVVVVFYQWFFFRKIKTHPLHTYSGEEVLPVSVVICAKNEAKNLSRFLKVVLMQQYEKFEVIVVNDQSIDDTAAVLSDYATRNPHLRIVTIPPSETKTYAGKKNALIAGVAAAAYSHILVTDADCQPANTHWIRQMANRFFKDTAFVLGYAPFYPAGGFWNKIMQFENCKTALFSLSFALRGIPVLGIGRNMAFTKETFNKNNYTTHASIQSGDDDLLVNQLAAAQTTEVVLHPDSFVYSAAAANFGEWWRQKARHVEAARYYKKAHLALIHLYNLSNFFGYALAVYGFFCPSMWVWGAVVLFLLSKIITYFFVQQRLALPLTNVSYFFIEPIYLFFEILLLILFISNPKKTWK